MSQVKVFIHPVTEPEALGLRFAAIVQQHCEPPHFTGWRMRFQGRARATREEAVEDAEFFCRKMEHEVIEVIDETLTERFPR